MICFSDLLGSMCLAMSLKERLRDTADTLKDSRSM
jgi:hypothetical protein